MAAKKGGYGDFRYFCNSCGYRHFFRSKIGMKHYRKGELT